MLEIRRGREVKFTPERIEQIKNLVERGKRREEIAELIGVTVGSLQVTCSRLGISLRPPRLKPVPTPPSKPAKAADVARFAISMRYRGEERTTELPLTQDMITQLAVEAAFRGVPICDLIGDLIMGMLQAHEKKRTRYHRGWQRPNQQKQDDISRTCRRGTTKATSRVYDGMT